MNAKVAGDHLPAVLQVRCVNCAQIHGVDEPCLPVWFHAGPGGEAS